MIHRKKYSSRYTYKQLSLLHINKDFYGIHSRWDTPSTPHYVLTTNATGVFLPKRSMHEKLFCKHVKYKSSVTAYSSSDYYTIPLFTYIDNKLYAIVYSEGQEIARYIVNRVITIESQISNIVLKRITAISKTNSDSRPRFPYGKYLKLYPMKHTKRRANGKVLVISTVNLFRTFIPVQKSFIKRAKYSYDDVISRYNRINLSQYDKNMLNQYRNAEDIQAYLQKYKNDNINTSTFLHKIVYDSVLRNSVYTYDNLIVIMERLKNNSPSNNYSIKYAYELSIINLISIMNMDVAKLISLYQVLYAFELVHFKITKEGVYNYNAYAKPYYILQNTMHLDRHTKEMILSDSFKITRSVISEIIRNYDINTLTVSNIISLYNFNPVHRAFVNLLIPQFILKDISTTTFSTLLHYYDINYTRMSVIWLYYNTIMNNNKRVLFSDITKASIYSAQVAYVIYNDTDIYTKKHDDDYIRFISYLGYISTDPEIVNDSFITFLNSEKLHSDIQNKKYVPFWNYKYNNTQNFDDRNEYTPYSNMHISTNNTYMSERVRIYYSYLKSTYDNTSSMIKMKKLLSESIYMFHEPFKYTNNAKYVFGKLFNRSEPGESLDYDTIQNYRANENKKALRDTNSVLAFLKKFNAGLNIIDDYFFLYLPVSYYYLQEYKQYINVSTNPRVLLLGPFNIHKAVHYLTSYPYTITNSEKEYFTSKSYSPYHKTDEYEEYYTHRTVNIYKQKDINDIVEDINSKSANYLPTTQLCFGSHIVNDSKSLMLSMISLMKTLYTYSINSNPFRSRELKIITDKNKQHKNRLYVYNYNHPSIIKKNTKNPLIEDDISNKQRHDFYSVITNYPVISMIDTI